MFKVEDVKGFKEASQELINEVKANVPSNGTIEDMMFAYEGNTYAMINLESDDEINDGKYVSGCKYYQLVSIDTSVAEYPRKDNIVDKFNVVISNSYSKCGSYFSDYEWYYDEPEIGIVSLKTIPEVVIPEHEEVDIKY